VVVWFRVVLEFLLSLWLGNPFLYFVILETVEENRPVEKEAGRWRRKPTGGEGSRKSEKSERKAERAGRPGEPAENRKPDVGGRGKPAEGRPWKAGRKLKKDGWSFVFNQ